LKVLDLKFTRIRTLIRLRISWDSAKELSLFQDDSNTESIKEFEPGETLTDDDEDLIDELCY